VARTTHKQSHKKCLIGACSIGSFEEKKSGASTVVFWWEKFENINSSTYRVLVLLFDFVGLQ
jgi:hypothetical protein